VNAVVRLLFGLVVVGGVVAGLLCLGGGWAASAGLDVWSLPELGRQIRCEGERAEELARVSDEGYRRVTAKGEVVEDFNAGRVSFNEAVVRFQALGVGRRVGPETPPAAAARARDELRSWVVSSLGRESPERQEEVLARLNAELAALTPAP
jgi:hypothetical protein